MDCKQILIIILFNFVFIILCQAKNLNVYTELVQMKNATSSRADDLRCTYIKADSLRRQYILGYTPHASKNVAHHMVLYGCKKPAYYITEETTDWYCGPGSVGICESNTTKEFVENIIYAWALDAKEYNFPEDVGFRVGGDTDHQYLVLQMHYKDKSDGLKKDNSGLSLKLTFDEMKYQVAYYILGGDGYIPPKTKEFHMESACKIEFPYKIVPLAYRTHAHMLGRVISGYLIQDGKWIELGRMSPQQPQMFYNVTNQNLLIDSNGILAARCTMDSTLRDNKTYMGSTHKDEMCNFYVMYYTNYTNNIKNTLCFNDAQKFSWNNSLNKYKDFPENASNLKGVYLLEPNNELKMNLNKK